MVDRIKSQVWLIVTSDRVFLVVLLVAVGVVSFLLGRQDGQLRSYKSESVAIIFNSHPAVAAEEGQSVVASRNGTKYYLPDCSGAARIKESNLIRFDSITLAQAAGYTPAQNCQGL